MLGKGFIIYNVPGDAVYAIDPNDTKPLRLFEVPYARPSPDGRYLALWQQEHGLDILSVTTGRKIKTIHVATPLGLDFAWSPNGRWIAYIGKVGREIYEIYLISVQNGSVRQLTFHHEIKRRLVWGLDSRSIFYGETGADRGKYWEISIQTPGKPKEYNLFHKGASFLGMIGAFFSFSNKGYHIAYGSATGDGGVYIALANGTNHRRVTPNGSYRTYHVAWSPDDSNIAFFSYYHETRSSVLYTVSRHNPEIKRLVEIPNTAYGLTWVKSSALAIEPTQKLTTIWGRLKVK